MRLILAIFGLTFIFAENYVEILSESRSEMLREYRFGPWIVEDGKLEDGQDWGWMTLGKLTWPVGRCFKCEDYRVGIESGEYLEYCLHPVTENIGMIDHDGNSILESCGTTGNCFTAIKDKLKCIFLIIKLSTGNSSPDDRLLSAYIHYV